MEAAMNNDNKLCKTILIGALIVITAISGVSLVSAEPNILDGKSYIGVVGTKGKAADGEDGLDFRDGNLFSPYCAEWGFGEGVYTARVEGNVIYFEAETTSAKHGKITYKGKVEGNKIDSTYIWTKKRWYWNDAYEESWFKGTLKE
jgi:hypothetical protein